MNFEPQTEDEKLQALRSLATAEDEAADDSEGIPSNPFGSAFGAAAASGLREKEPASPVEVGEFKSRALADTATPEARGAEAVMGYPAELWSKPVQGPELPPDDEPERDELDYFAGVDKLSTPEATADFKAAGDNALAKLDAQKPAPASASSSGFSAQMLQQLLGAAPSDGADDIAALKKAQAADKQQYWNSRLSDAIAAWVQRKPLGAEAPPSEAANVMAQLQLQKQRRDEQARYADAARRLMTAGGKSGVPDWYYRDLADSRRSSDETRRLEAELRREQFNAQRGDKAAERRARELEYQLRVRQQEFREKLARNKAARGGGPTKLEEARRKEGLKRTAGMPAGYELAEDANPLDDQKKQLFKADVSEKKLRGLTSEMRKALDAPKNASQLPEWRRHLKTLATAVQLEAKNVAELGALSGPDMGLMEALASDPSKLINQTGLKGDMAKMLDDLDAWGANSTRSVADAIGAKPRAGGSSAFKPVTVKKGEEQYDIDNPEDLEEAKRAGFQVLQ